MQIRLKRRYVQQHFDIANRSIIEFCTLQMVIKIARKIETKRNDDDVLTLTFLKPTAIVVTVIVPIKFTITIISAM